MKKTPEFLNILALTILFTITLSCEKDTLPQEEQARSLQEMPVQLLKTGFSLENFADPASIIKGNIEIQWENHSAKTINETLWYEFGITQKQKTDMVSQFQEDNQYKLLASLDESNDPHYFIVKLAPQKWVMQQEFSYLNPEGLSDKAGFSGTASLYNIQGEVVFLEYYKKGQVQNSVQDISIKGELTTPVSNKCMQRGTAMAKCDSALECAFVLADGASTGGGCSGGTTGGSYVAVRTDHYTDWYNIRSDGTADYSHTQFNGSTYEYVYVNSSGTSGGHQDAYSYYIVNDHGAYGTANEEGYYSHEPPLAEIPERIIIALEDKEKCINKLLMKNGGNYMNEILKHFKGESEFDIKIESRDKVISKNTGEEINGKTKPPKDGIITIQISTSKALEHSVLVVAKTILHEYIHADMYRKLHTKYPADEDLDFRTTYEAYEKDVFKGTSQHESMAALYIDEMTRALKNFHKNVLKGDYNYLTDNGTNPLPDSFYEALAWQGLAEDGVAAYAELSDEKKQELDDSIAAYYHSTTKNCPKTN